MAPCDVKLLVVEDDPMVRRAVVRDLSKSGFTQVSQAENGAVALDMLQGVVVVDVVLTDWTMPELTGLDLLHSIRSSPKLAHLQVVIFSANLSHGQHLAALELGIAGFIEKPWKLNELVRIIMLAVNGG